MKFFSAFFSLSLLLFFGAAAPVSAQSFSFRSSFDAPANCAVENLPSHSPRAGTIKDFVLNYDEGLQLLDIDILFERCRGTRMNGSSLSALANGFTLVVNGGGSPKGHAGELAILYFDYRDHSNPRVTAYGYNGSGALSDYRDGLRDDPFDGEPGHPGLQTPDRIIHDGNADFLLHSNIEESRSGGEVSHRRMTFQISTAQINGWNPHYGAPGVTWDGVAFGHQIGLWLHPVELSDQTEYCEAGDAAASSPCNMEMNGISSAGYLKNWNWNVRGFYDFAWRDTNSSPICTSHVSGPLYDASAGCYRVEIGERIEGEFLFTDPLEPFEVHTDTNLPASALSPSSPAAFTGEGRIILDWTASLADQGKRYSAQLIALDPLGASSHCGVEICVTPNSPPVCEISLTGDSPAACQGTETRIGFSGADSRDPDSEPLRYEFSTTCDDATLELSDSGVSGDLVLRQPGNGVAVQGCEVSLTVRDPMDQVSTCQVSVDVRPCDRDCLDVPNGDAVLDQCGVCGGDGTSCLDCAGNPFGNAKNDICGVCNGDGTSCLDCAGTPFGVAVLDQCDVCGGPGTSCVQCESVNIKQLQFTADASVKSAQRLLNQAGFRKARGAMRKAGLSTKRFEKLIRRLIKIAIEIQIRAWTAIWIPASEISLCNDAAASVCVTVSNEEELKTYFDNAEELRQFTRKHTRGIIRRSFLKGFLARGIDKKRAKRRARKKALVLRGRVEGFIDSGVADAKLVPASHSLCQLG